MTILTTHLRLFFCKSSVTLLIVVQVVATYRNRVVVIQSEQIMRFLTNLLQSSRHVHGASDDLDLSVTYNTRNLRLLIIPHQAFVDYPI